MALTTVSSLSEMYSGSMSSAAGDFVIKPVERIADTDVPDPNPTPMEGESSTDVSKEVEA